MKSIANNCMKKYRLDWERGACCHAKSTVNHFWVKDEFTKLAHAADGSALLSIEHNANVDGDAAAATAAASVTKITETAVMETIHLTHSAKQQRKGGLLLAGWLAIFGAIKCKNVHFL